MNFHDDLEEAANTNGVFDNHFRRQVSFLMPNHSYNVLKFENGMEKIKEFIDLHFGTAVVEEMGHLKKSEQSTSKFELSTASHDILRKIYQIDFEKFNYSQAIKKDVET